MFTEGCLMIRRILTIVLWLIALGTVNVASAETYAEALTKQCQKGKAEGCFKLGVAYDNGLGVTQDSVKAAELFRKACDGQNAGGCAALGVAYSHGTGATQDSFKAAELFRKACDGQYAGGCWSLGVSYDNG